MRLSARVPLVSGIVSSHEKSSFFVFFRLPSPLDVASRLTPRDGPPRLAAPDTSARRLLAAFTAPLAPLDCAAPPRLVRSTRGLFPSPFPRARALAATRRDRRTGDMTTRPVVQTRHSARVDRSPRRASRPPSIRAPLARRSTRRGIFTTSNLASRPSSRASRARVRRRTRGRAVEF